MSANMEENGIRVYQDDHIEVRVNVDPNTEMEEFEYHRETNCIKITASSSNAHFIQFVTRQYPDIYKFNQSGKVQWDSEPGQFYMQDAINPRWKLDVTDDSKSCFYEEGGLNKKSNGSISMYDDPSGLYLPAEDRATFCTFVMTNNKVTHLVQWSKQYFNIPDPSESIEFVEGYLVKVKPWEKHRPLPFWSLNIIRKHYEEKSEAIPKELATEEMLREVASIPADSLDAESRQFFMPPPDNWYTYSRFPSLLEQFKKETQEASVSSSSAMSQPLVTAIPSQPSTLSQTAAVPHAGGKNKSAKGAIDFDDASPAHAATPVVDHAVHAQTMFPSYQKATESSKCRKAEIKRQHEEFVRRKGKKDRKETLNNTRPKWKR